MLLALLIMSNTHEQVETFGRVTLEACASGKPCIVDKGAHLLNVVIVVILFLEYRVHGCCIHIF